jgi:serine/threonine-protein phosphatase 6 regulatory ankyrin repeat subunit B
MIASAPIYLDEEVKKIKTSIQDLIDHTISRVEGVDEDLFDNTETKIKSDGPSDVLNTEKIVVKGGIDEPDYHAVVRKLVAAGTTVDQKNRKKQTALFMAAASGDDAVVEILAAANADLNPTDIEDKTPLLAASLNRHEKVANLLSARGVSYRPADLKMTEVQEFQKNVLAPSTRAAEKMNTSARNSTGQTPLLIACTKNDVEQVRLLIENGAEVNAKDFNGITALMIASVGGFNDLVSLLLKNKADPEIKNVKGWTALALAVSAGKVDAVKSIVQAKGRFDFKLKGVTLLMLGAAKGHADVVQYLLELGVDLSEKDYRGQAASDYAKNGKHMQIVELLKAKQESDLKKTQKNGSRK